MRRPRPLLLVPALTCLLLAGGCTVSDKMRPLPPVSGLVPLNRLEHHLDYFDPYEGRPSYRPVKGGGQ